MTGYTVHTGSTVKFADGWDQVFGKKSPTPKKHAGTSGEPTSAHVHSEGVRRKKSKKKKGATAASSREASPKKSRKKKKGAAKKGK